MYAIYINLEGGGTYNLCKCADLLSLWSIVECLMGDGTKGIKELGIVRCTADEITQVYRAPMS